MATSFVTESRDVTKISRQADIEVVAMYMNQLRRTGLTPSDCVNKGLDFAEAYVRDEFGDLSAMRKMLLSAHIWEQAARTTGLHATERREAKAQKE